ncbi:DUF2931 family protein [Vibrio salinus]|uniref:DUF2931 family protein n=1 Tax=Vibrio salinus TaxID=2899784 RepID=UPI001E625FD1|nr:DUF2931 family protein [Vibrio salinus]MCE0492491.1 DUF2931 family protein [Vibrio salinus]
MKKIVKFFTLSIGLICFGCTNNYSLAQRSDTPSWRVKVARPSYYPIKAIEIYGINNQEDWTVPLIGLVRAGNSSSLKSVRRYYDKNYYDGYGIVLTPYLNSTLDQPMRNSVPPDSMYIKWVSLFDNTLYYTKIHFSNDIMKFMNYREHDDLTHSDCYHNTIVLGFLPNGHVKTWLYGCGRYTYISDQEPDKTIKTKVPNEYDPNDYTFYIDPLIKNAKKEGSSIIPVPWDKVDKVTIPPINYRLENFSDIDKTLFH